MAIPMPGPYETPRIIQEILQRRREESRQAMMDKLQEERIHADIAAEQQRLEQGRQQLDIGRGQLGVEQAAEQRAALMDEVQRREATERTRTERINRLPGYTPLSDMPTDLAADVEAAGLARPGSYGTFGPDTGQTLDDALSSATPPKVFAGTPEFQQNELTRRRAGEYARGLKSDDPLRKVIEARMSGAGDISPRDVADRKNLVYHNGQLVRTDTIGPYDEVTNLGHPYQLTAAGVPRVVYEINQATGEVVGSFPSTPDTISAIIDAITSRGNVPQVGGQPFGLGQGMERAKDVAATNYVNAYRITNRSRRLEALPQAATNLINQTAVSDPNLKAKLHTLPAFIDQQVEKRGELPYDIDQQILESIKREFPGISPQELTDITETVQMLLRPVPRRARPASSSPVAAPAAPIVQR